MITLKDFMETVDYRVTEGSEYWWRCFGDKAYRLDSWNGDQDGHTVSIVFDTATQEVYSVEAFDYRNERAYRMINPAYKEAYDNEVQERDIEDEAWQRDDGTSVKFVDLESEEDFLEKARAIVLGEDYDTRVSIPLNMDKDGLLLIFQAAHERDMTFNQFVEQAVKDFIEEFKRDPDAFVRKHGNLQSHETGTDDPIDFPKPAKMQAKKKKSKGRL